MAPSRWPCLEAGLTRELVSCVQTLRTLGRRKSPSISETVDWARAMLLLHAQALDPDLIGEDVVGHLRPVDFLGVGPGRLQLDAHGRQGAAQLMRRVGGEPALGGGGRLQAVQHGVHG